MDIQWPEELPEKGNIEYCAGINEGIRLCKSAVEKAGITVLPPLDGVLERFDKEFPVSMDYTHAEIRGFLKREMGGEV